MLDEFLYAFWATASENNLELFPKVKRFLCQLRKVGEEAFNLLHQQLAARDRDVQIHDQLVMGVLEILIHPLLNLR